MKFCTEKELNTASKIESLEIGYAKYFTHYGQIWANNLRNFIIESRLVHNGN